MCIGNTWFTLYSLFYYYYYYYYWFPVMGGNDLYSLVYLIALQEPLLYATFLVYNSDRASLGI